MANFDSIFSPVQKRGFALRNTNRKISILVPRKYFQFAVLLTAYVLSNVFRTMPAILAPGITEEYALSIQSVGYFLAAFNFAFGGMQLFVGITVDRFGDMRSVAWLLLFTCAGSALSTFASSFAVLLIGQALIGIGCSAIFLGCLVFLSKKFSPKLFAGLSGFTLGVGGCGMLLTATPLAIVVEAWSWRGAFLIAAFSSVLVTVAAFVLSEKTFDVSRDGPSETLKESCRLVGSLLWRRGTLGILLMGGVGYAAMISVRGFWIVPLLSERYSLSLVQSGNAVLLMSLGMTLSPLFYGLLDPGGTRRRALIIASALTMAAAIGWLGVSHTETVIPTIIGIAIIGAVSGFTILQYADVRSSFEPAVIGRSLSLLNMSVFIGAALVQLLAGFVSDKAASFGLNPLSYVFLFLVSIIVVGCLAFRFLPVPEAKK